MSLTTISFKEQFPAIAEHCGPQGLEDLIMALETRQFDLAHSRTATHLVRSIFLIQVRRQAL